MSFVTLRLCFHEVNVAKLSPTTLIKCKVHIKRLNTPGDPRRPGGKNVKRMSPRHAAVGSPPCCELQKQEKRTKGIRLTVCFFLCFLCACVCILLGQGALCFFFHLWVWDALRVYLEGRTLGKERIDCDTLLLPCFVGGSILNALWMAVHCSSLWTRFPHCNRIVSCSKDEMVYDLMNVRASQSDLRWAKLEIWRFL